MLRRSILTMAVWVGVSGAVVAAPTVLDDCQDNDPNISIDACTTLIESGDEPGDFLDVLYSLRALGYQRARDFAKAVQDFTEALRLTPDDPQHAPQRAGLLAIRASASFYTADYNQAIADYTESIRLAPPEASSYNGRAYVYLKLKNYDAAIADYDVALKNDPKRAQSLYGRGLAKRAKGDVVGGAKDMAKAKKLQGDVAAGFVHDGVDTGP